MERRSQKLQAAPRPLLVLDVDLEHKGPAGQTGLDSMEDMQVDCPGKQVLLVIEISQVNLVWDPLFCFCFLCMEMNALLYSAVLVVSECRQCV